VKGILEWKLPCEELRNYSPNIGRVTNESALHGQDVLITYEGNENAYRMLSGNVKESKLGRPRQKLYLLVIYITTLSVTQIM
jgi:hypothetical protein